MLNNLFSTDENYELNSGFITNLLIESDRLFRIEEEYTKNILGNCTEEFISKIYAEIIQEPLNKIVQGLKELVEVRQSKKAHKMTLDFFHNFDVLNVWYEKLQKAFLGAVKKYTPEQFELIRSLIDGVEGYCFDFIKNYIEDLINSKEKPENENIMQICNRVSRRR